MPRISPARAEEIRQRILAAASRVFAERGFHDASIQDVVRESGLSVGAIYTYFGSKDELVRASCLAAIGDAVDAVIADLQHAGSVREKFDRAIDAWFVGLIADPGGPSFLAQAWAAGGEQPTIRDLLLRRRERIVTVVTMLLREAVVRGEAPADVDVDGAALGISALLDGIVLARLEDPERFDRASCERPLRAIIDCLLQPPSASGPRVPATTAVRA